MMMMNFSKETILSKLVIHLHIYNIRKEWGDDWICLALVLQSNQWTCWLNNKELTFFFWSEEKEKDRLFFVSLVVMWKEKESSTGKYLSSFNALMSLFPVVSSERWWAFQTNNVDEWQPRFFSLVLDYSFIFIALTCKFCGKTCLFLLLILSSCSISCACSYTQTVIYLSSFFLSKW
jgi:hypothetical protein